MGTTVRPAKTSAGPRDTLDDVDAFVSEGLAELEIMAKDGTRPVLRALADGGFRGRRSG